jgi:hypothetical protein
MAWARISDDFHDHAKVAELTVDLEGLAALGLWTLALSWVRADRRRAGIVPVGIAMRLSAGNGKQLASRLVDAQLWDEVPGGWRFHDFDQVYTPEDLAQKRAEAGRRGGVASGQTRRAKAEGSKNEANLKQFDSFREAKQAEASRARPGATTHYPDASYEASPPLSPPEGGRRTRGTSKPDDPDFARFWDAYPRKEAKGAARRAWAKAIKTADADAVIAGAARYRHDPRREERFTAHAATWLNSERWLDQTPTTRAVGDAIGGAFWDN